MNKNGGFDETWVQKEQDIAVQEFATLNDAVKTTGGRK